VFASGAGYRRELVPRLIPELANLTYEKTFEHWSCDIAFQVLHRTGRQQ
jgi:hypothetical protein